MKLLCNVRSLDPCGQGCATIYNTFPYGLHYPVFNLLGRLFFHILRYVTPYYLLSISSPCKFVFALNMSNCYLKHSIFDETQESRGAPAKKPPPDYFL